MTDNYLHHPKGLHAQAQAHALIEDIGKFGAETYGESWRISSRNMDQIAKMLIRFYEDGKASATTPRMQLPAPVEVSV